jgi:hypothetical protein
MRLMSRICQYFSDYATSNLTGPLVLLQYYIHGLSWFDIFAVLSFHQFAFQPEIIKGLLDIVGR